MSTQRDERDDQLAAVLDALAARPLPRVLLGDLNGPPEDVAALIESAGLRLVLAGPTFPAHAPQRQIDHVATAGLEVVAHWVPESPVSDHRPLVVDVSDAPGPTRS